MANFLMEVDHLTITVNGHLHMPYRNTPLAPCIHCGADLPRSSDAVGRLARMWVVAGDKPIKLLMSDAKNPLSRIRGFPMIAMNEQCPVCHLKNTVVGQLIY